VVFYGQECLSCDHKSHRDPWHVDYSSILHALENASAFDLFRLQQAIEVALKDPKRIAPAMASLSVGQETTFFDYQTNRPAYLFYCMMKTNDTVCLTTH